MLSRKVRFIVCFILVATMLAGVTAHAGSIIKGPSRDIYVSDYGEIFTRMTEVELMASARELEEMTSGIRVAVLTEEPNTTDEFDSYARNAYLHFYGQKQNAVLIFVEKGNANVGIHIGDDVLTYISQKDCYDFWKKYAMSYAQKGNYDECIKIFQACVIETIRASYTSGRPATIVEHPIVIEQRKGIGWPLYIGTILFFVIVCIFIYKIISAKFVSDKARKNNSYKSEIVRRVGQVESLQKKIEHYEATIVRQNRRIIALNFWKKRAIELYPEIEAAVEEKSSDP